MSMKETPKLTPKEAIRVYCTQCLGMKQYNTEQIRECEGDHVRCAFFPYSLGKRPPVKVFRTFCIDCMGGYRDSVTDCPTVSCECYPYRTGRNPALKGKRKASKEGMAALKIYREKHRDDTKDGLKLVFTYQGVDGKG